MTPTSPASMTPSPPATATPSTQAPPRAATGPIAALGANDRAAPPHPFRSSPWYDPRVVDPAPKPAPRDHRIASRVTLVVLGGIVMPIVSLVINARLHVVSLRAAGIVLVAASTLVPLAHLIWLPLRRARRGTKGHIEAPRSTLALIALLVAGLLSALLWAYLGVLFLPMIPLSVVGILFMGLGACGLTPYLAVAVAIVEIVRAARALGERVGQKRLVLIMTATLALPILTAGGAGLRHIVQARKIERVVATLKKSATFSLARMRAIEDLEGSAEKIPAVFAATSNLDDRRALAEAYLRLTDRPLKARPWGRSSRHFMGAIRPWWFIDGGGAFHFTFFNHGF